MLTKINSISKYFKYDSTKETLTFTGKKLIVRIPERYSVYGLLDVNDTTTTLGIVDLIFDDKEQAGLLLLAMIEIGATSEMKEIIDGLTYRILELHSNDIFIMHTQVVQNTTIAYSMFVEFVAYGKLPYFIDYDTSATLFDSAKKMTGVNLDIDHVIFELIDAHLYRDKDNLNKFYRHTDMKSTPTRIMLRSVSHGPESTTAKLLGSYFNDGLTSALLHESENQHDIEDYLRQ